MMRPSIHARFMFHLSALPDKTHMDSFGSSAPKICAVHASRLKEDTSDRQTRGLLLTQLFAGLAGRGELNVQLLIYEPISKRPRVQLLRAVSLTHPQTSPCVVCVAHSLARVVMVVFLFM